MSSDKYIMYIQDENEFVRRLTLSHSAPGFPKSYVVFFMLNELRWILMEL